MEHRNRKIRRSEPTARPPFGRKSYNFVPKISGFASSLLHNRNGSKNSNLNSSGTRTRTRHQASRVGLVDQEETIPRAVTAKTTTLIKKNPLAATATPPATPPLGMTKATKEQPKHRPSRRKQSTLMKATAPTVTVFSPILTTTFHRPLSTFHFQFPQPSLSTNLASMSVRAEMRLLPSILIVRRPGGLGQTSWPKPPLAASTNDFPTASKQNSLSGSSTNQCLTERSTI